MSSATARPKWTAIALIVLALFGLTPTSCGDDSQTPAAPEEDPFVHPAPQPVAWAETGCTAAGCHDGIEPIRALDSGMMKEILAIGSEVGDADGCVVCHGGQVDVDAPDPHQGTIAALEARGGPDGFYADPASPWINARSCGQCHAELVQAQWNSLMMTEAGKIQGTTWSFGTPAEGDYTHRWANYATKNPEDPHARLGTDAYRSYMRAKSAAHPDVFVDHHDPVPDAPDSALDLESLERNPGQAAFTYIRQECQRCHLGVKGRARRGDYRGMGCGACHVPYGNEGRYEGSDRTIDPDEGGHPLVHRLQGTRDATVYVHDQPYTGIPVETCTTCHNRGKRIGVSYQGLMESAYASPYTEGGGGQIGLHTKHYIAMEQDVHYQRGMLCQDCHTSGDVHGDGFLAAANLGPIEIECSDCHGTPQAYPWDLPLGYGDENGRGDRATGPGRGVAMHLPPHLRKGDPGAPRDGHLLTARGNPMPEVVRIGDEVLIRTVGGKNLRLEPLKRKLDQGTLSPEAKVAMVHASKHMETMECYACHASWAPQCYGCHVEVDYSEAKTGFDWVAAGRKHLLDEHRADPSEDGYGTNIPGKVTEMRSYLRWEDPALGVNGEGRVSPLIPGCQVAATIIGPDGKEVVRNHIFRTPAGTEGAGEQGQLGIDMSPVQPHTIGKSRTCESCHGSEKAMGYGIEGVLPWDEAKVVDLTTADGRVIPGSARAQVQAIDGLDHDWSAVVTPDGRQLQTVGHHFQASGPLSPEQRLRMDRQSVCVGCHEQIPEGDLATSFLHHIADATGQLPVTREEHASLVSKILSTAAWAQVGLGVLIGVALGGGGLLWWRRRRSAAA